MIVNKKLKNLIECEQRNKFIFNGNMEKLFLPNFVKVYDCVIISDDLMELNMNDFTKIIHRKGNKSGYEYSCNEILINSFVDEHTTMSDLIYIGTLSLQIWSKQLKTIDPESAFCFILSVDENSGFVTIFVHKYRTEEGMWISDDIELYNQPVGYIIL